MSLSEKEVTNKGILKTTINPVVFIGGLTGGISTNSFFKYVNMYMDRIHIDKEVNCSAVR